MPAIEAFLATAVVPIRISAIDGDFPFICSIWFHFHDDALWCAAHERTKLIQLLRNNPRCAFDVSPNEPPYRGVRGKAIAQLHRNDVAQKTLETLTTRYLDNNNSNLRAWLLSRSHEEYAIQLNPTWITSWDYSDRMAP